MDDVRTRTEGMCPKQTQNVSDSKNQLYKLFPFPIGGGVIPDMPTSRYTNCEKRDGEKRRAKMRNVGQPRRHQTTSQFESSKQGPTENFDARGNTLPPIQIRHNGV